MESKERRYKPVWSDSANLKHQQQCLYQQKYPTRLPKISDTCVAVPKRDKPLQSSKCSVFVKDVESGS